jgi:hypothetical protein
MNKIRLEYAVAFSASASKKWKIIIFVGILFMLFGLFPNFPHSILWQSRDSFSYVQKTYDFGLVVFERTNAYVPVWIASVRLKLIGVLIAIMGLIGNKCSKVWQVPTAAR